MSWQPKSAHSTRSFIATLFLVQKKIRIFAVFSCKFVKVGRKKKWIYGKKGDERRTFMKNRNWFSWFQLWMLASKLFQIRICVWKEWAAMSFSQIQTDDWGYSMLPLSVFVPFPIGIKSFKYLYFMGERYDSKLRLIKEWEEFIEMWGRSVIYFFLKI